jgi:hypothetical protein
MRNDALRRISATMRNYAEMPSVIFRRQSVSIPPVIDAVDPATNNSALRSFTGAMKRAMEKIRSHMSKYSQRQAAALRSFTEALRRSAGQATRL